MHDNQIVVRFYVAKILQWTGLDYRTDLLNHKKQSPATSMDAGNGPLLSFTRSPLLLLKTILIAFGFCIFQLGFGDRYWLMKAKH